MQFSDLKLIDPLLKAIAETGYTTPTTIQSKAIPPVLEGRDVLGLAQTGTGKTAAFALPLLQRIAARPRGRSIRALILTPTRELASQIGENIATYGKHVGITHTVIFGGVSQLHQERALRRGPEILVATPGRLLDLCNQRLVRFDQVEHFVLDEADRMLDMGFLHDVRRILSLLPRTRQNLLFSATMPPEIASLAGSILVKPERVEAAQVGTTADRIDQSVRFVSKEGKRGLLVDLLRDPAIERALVFTRTKHGADRVVKQLEQANISSAAIHGNKSQGARERALGGFKSGDTRVLVATDIAARGIDVTGISHVFNFDLPHVPESYVHRIGRTARAGASGIAVSFCDREERPLLAAIERLIGTRIAVAGDAPAQHPQQPAAPRPMAPRPQHNGASPAPLAPQSTQAGGPASASPTNDPHSPSGRRFRRRRFRRAA
jgi:ATP-dependent RNA helicase RhlE